MPRALAFTLSSLLALSACASSDPDDGDAVAEVPGQTLDHAAFCPDVEVSSLRRFHHHEFWSLGPCGDALLRSPEGVMVLVPIDGAPVELSLWSERSQQLSPRGRLLLSQDHAQDTIEVRELGTDETQIHTLVDGARSGFVISKHAPGARVWTCGGGRLELLIDGAFESLASNVNCETVAPSSMHSLLAFATVNHKVTVADTDAGILETTSIADFEHSSGNALGVRKDRLSIPVPGPYLVHQRRSIQDNDGAPDELPIDETLFALDRDVALATDSTWLRWVSAQVFGAPPFVILDDDLFVVRDGALASVVEDIKYSRAAPAIDGSVVVLEGDNSIARYSGDQHQVREIELPAAPESFSIELSPSGSAGVTTGNTDLCATPSCSEKLRSLRVFGGAAAGPLLLSAGWITIIHVYDDGTVLADIALVDGPFAEEVEQPARKLTLIARDGAVLAAWEHDPNLYVNDWAVLADGRVVVPYATFNAPSELVVVDKNTATIEPVAGYDAAAQGAGSIFVDALGERIAMRYQQSGGGVVWGQIAE